MEVVSANKGHRALRRGRVSLVGQVYLITTVTADRTPLFTDTRLAFAACRALHRTTRDGDLETVCWVLMPDHLHVLARLLRDDLSQGVGYLKARMAHEVNAMRSTKAAVWSRGFHDRALRREEDLRTMARYVIANPLRARLVSSVRAYPFWDAAWL